MLKSFLIAASLCLLPAAAMAQDSHGHDHAAKGPHGGIVKEVGGQDTELVVGDGAVTLYLLDSKTGSPVPVDGAQASVLFTQGATRKGTLVLHAAGDKLEGKGEVPDGADIVVSLRTKAGKSGQAKFELGGHDH
jgi:hypothetical protein